MQNHKHSRCHVRSLFRYSCLQIVFVFGIGSELSFGYRMPSYYSDALNPYHTYPKIWTNSFYYLSTCILTAGWVANSVDPGQTPRFAASDLGLHYLLRLFHPITEEKIRHHSYKWSTQLFQFACHNFWYCLKTYTAFWHGCRCNQTSKSFKATKVCLTARSVHKPNLWRDRHSTVIIDSYEQTSRNERNIPSDFVQNEDSDQSVHPRSLIVFILRFALMTIQNAHSVDSECAGWYESSLAEHARRYVFGRGGSYLMAGAKWRGHDS